jgi:hypothetical protein
MKKLSLIVLLSLSGCAAQQVHLQEHAATSYQVPVQKLIIDNLAVDKKVDPSESIYVNGWAPVIGPDFKPSLSMALAAKTKNSITATGETGRADVSILRTGFFVEKTVADDMVFVDFFTLGKERGYKCDVDINVKTDNDSQRLTLSHEIRRSYFDDFEQMRQFVEVCQDDLVRQIADKVKSSAS